MYVRIKHGKETAFVNVDHYYNIYKLKLKLSRLPFLKAPIPDDIRLFLPNDPIKFIEDRRTILDLKLQNDDILYMIYKRIENEIEVWEDVNQEEIVDNKENQINTIKEEEEVIQEK